MKINLNSRCTAILTEAGAKVYNEYMSQFTFRGRREPNAKVGFAHKTSLWDLMHIYGEHTFIGRPEPFEGCEIDVEPLV
jgi:hypothetical protein